MAEAGHLTHVSLLFCFLTFFHTMAQCRDLENHHHEKLLEISINTLEKIVKSEFEEEIPDDVRMVRTLARGRKQLSFKVGIPGLQEEGAQPVPRGSDAVAKGNGCGEAVIARCTSAVVMQLLPLSGPTIRS